jgi:dihydrofolate synthase/folylpolyglutamate synthase
VSFERPSDPAYAAALDALGRRGPGRMLPDLGRITRLAQLLGDPHLSYPSVHVTGTNGKGSVVRMVGALCSAAGLSAGTYTSPHLQTVRERLQLAGRPISERRFTAVHDEVAVLTELLDQAAREATGPEADQVTYFEQLTAMAYWWFADAPVDVGVFEVGMGGRWDATNLVRGEVAVINEVDVDHPQLGSTPAEVAQEKVGIIKPGAQVVTARQLDEVEAVIDAAVAEAGATRWRAGADFEVLDRRVAVGGQLLTLRVRDRIIDDILLPLYGVHQARNAALALAAFAAFTDEAFAAMDDDVVRHGLGAVAIPGRLELVHREPTVVLDGAHNPHGARASAAALEESFGFRELVLVVACLDDKDISGILGAFRTAASHVIVTRADAPRAATLERMHELAVEVWDGTGTPVEVAQDVDAALTLAHDVVGEGDGILVAGSLHAVGSARDRYLPVEDTDDTVVYEPEDLDDPDDAPPLGEQDLERLQSLLEDRDAFDAAVERLLEED